MDTSTVAAILISLVFSVGAQAPVLSIEPRVVSVRQGESISIRCIVDGREHPFTREWKKSHSLPLADNVKVSPDGSVLTIADAQPDNQGQYRCVVFNYAGRTSGTAVLNVRYPPTVTLTPAGPLRVRVGEPVSIECRGTGRPRPTLKWKRQGSTLDLVTKATEDVNTIEWAVVRPEDSGVYACQAQNNEGMTEVKVEMTVQRGQGAPLASVAVKEITAVQGHTVTMECHASGTPKPVITWSKLRAPLPWKHTVSGSVLTVTDVGRQDSGQYICNATNTHGYSEAYVQMEVESPPYATCLPDQVRVRAGDSLRLQCLAHGSPPLSFQWRRAGRASLAPSAETTSDGRLLIAQVKVADSGTYKCVASNHIGSSEALAKVTVKKLLFMLKSVSSSHEVRGDGNGDNNCKPKCGNHSTCFKSQELTFCNCQTGFKEHNNKINFTFGGQCVDINECWNNSCGPNATCNNTIGSYNCTCHSGYEKQNATSGMCIDIDECKDREKPNEGLCGIKGTCINTNGSFWCQCPSGYTVYGNERTPCSELKCDQFTGPIAASPQSHGGLAEILSQIKRSCLALAQPDLYGNETSGPTVLLNSLFDITEDFLSDNEMGDSVAVSGLLRAVEDSIKFIGPQLRDDQTSINTSQTETKIVMWKKMTPPSGLVHLTNTNASLEADWSTAIGNGTYPGFALAALVSYKNLENMLNQSFEQIIVPEKNGRKPSCQVFSKVVSALVSNPDTQHLDQPVILTLRHLKELEESTEVSYTCAYWKAAVGGLQEKEGGAWSTTGCTQVSSNASYTVCSCTHLSSFAVLMALYPVNHTFGLMLLTKLCLVISLLCLALCILTFKFCRSIKGTRTTIHLHLCICLFVADLVFLAGISMTQPQGGCRLVAALLHLFFLGAFSWMLLEGVQLYRMVVLVFNTTIRPLYLYTVGYGVPLVIVIISAISRPTGYGTDQYCWLTVEQGLIWSFFGPVFVVIGLNVFFFSVTVWKLAQKFSSLNPDLTHLHKIRAFTVTAIAQLCVLGLMWLSGVFLFNEGALVAAYTFTILNSLQGALIFLLNCLLSKQVRDEYAKLLSCVCPQTKKKYSDFSSTNRSSQSQASRSGQPTSESNA